MSKSMLQHVRAADEALDAEVDINKPAILGTYEGECADANITNLNGLDITRPVWEHVFASDEYKRAIELGHLIGFLGHPQDSGCQDFEHACIVMKEGHIAENGKVYGKFDLVDTPVGRIVKTFQDAGVRFGISVRGAGDVINNSVEPETFVFRGFDLVAFPAYPNSIPKFTAIAASSDAEQQAQYKKICAAVETNIDSLNTVEAVDIVAAQFAEQSDMRKKLEARRAELLSDTDDVAASEATPEMQVEVLAQKLEGMTQLYISATEQLNAASAEIKAFRNELKAADRKLRVVKRITAAQQADLEAGYDEIRASYDKITASYETVKRTNNKIKAEYNNIQKQNLKYKQDINASCKQVAEKDSVISKLRSELAETVNASTDLKSKSSNLDAINKKLTQRIEAAEKLIQDYQDAYASLYANAIGAELNNVRVTASTSVSELQQSIRGNISSGSTSVMASTGTPSDLDVDSVGDDDDSDTLVTL